MDDESSNKKSGLPNHYLVLVLALLALGYFVTRRNGKIANAPERAPASAVSHESKAQLQAIAPRAADTRMKQDDLNRMRMEFSQERALGVKSLPVQDKGDMISIPLVFVPRKVWCQGGDLDTMKYAARSAGHKDFLISLESLEGGGKSAFVRVSLRELFKDVNFTFTIPKPKSATSYGLFICSDSRKENSCQKKSLKTHTQMSDELAAHAGKPKAEDRVFFFQNLVIDDKEVESYRSDDFTTEFQKSIGRHLSEKGIQSADLQKAWKANSTMKSAPADIRDGKIVLSLPYNDPRCVAGASRMPQ